MIRGAQKKMIVIRTHDSRVFEEAYFVIRRDGDVAADDGDMLTEADRIIRRSTAGSERDLRKDRRSTVSWAHRICWFVVGLVAGSGGTGLLLWLL